jgi:hypothetical protein
MLRSTVSADANMVYQQMFSYRDKRDEKKPSFRYVQLYSFYVWFFGVTAFAGPVLVAIIPIESMVRLLAILMVDPLGPKHGALYKICERKKTN